MRKFPVSLLLIVILVLGSVTFYFFSSKINNDIKGASTISGDYSSPGVAISVIANSSAWDLITFLCTSVQECISSPNSGKRLSTVSGGATELREIKISYDKSWESYSYIKFYMKPSWLIGGNSFRVVTFGGVPGTIVEKVPALNSFEEVVLVPVNEVSEVFYKSATFSDR